MRTVSRPLYRIRQVGWALRPRVTDEERAEAREILGDRLYTLFCAMEGADQRHCIDVYGAARAAGCADDDVLTAALIHDCGKTPSAEDGRIRIWHRVIYVSLHAVAPSLLRRLAKRPGGLRLLDQHSERGIEIAADHGAPFDVLDLMRRMEDGTDGDARVRLLRSADDAA